MHVLDGAAGLIKADIRHDVISMVGVEVWDLGVECGRQGLAIFIVAMSVESLEERVVCVCHISMCVAKCAIVQVDPCWTFTARTLAHMIAREC